MENRTIFEQDRAIFVKIWAFCTKMAISRVIMVRFSIQNHSWKAENLFFLVIKTGAWLILNEKLSWESMEFKLLNYLLSSFYLWITYPAQLAVTFAYKRQLPLLWCLLTGRTWAKYEVGEKEPKYRQIIQYTFFFLTETCTPSFPHYFQGILSCTSFTRLLKCTCDMPYLFAHCAHGRQANYNLDHFPP